MPPFRALSCGFAFVAASLPAFGQLAFVSGPPLPESGRGTFVAAADFDGDGVIDVVTSRAPDPGFQLLLGLGDGSFALRSGVTGPRSVNNMAVGDFDRDGDVDLACVNMGNASLDLYRGDGAGAFALPLVFPAGTSPSTVDAADFDRDGFSDVVVTDPAGTGPLFFRGVPGGLSPASSLQIAGAFAADSADFDLDGFRDLVVIAGSTVLTFLGDGAWGWQPAATLTASAGNDVSVGDFDGDGLSDIAWAYNWRGQCAVIRFGDGFGGFLGDVAAVRGGEFGYRIVALGPDAEGRTDLAVTTAREVYVRFARPSGHENVDWAVWLIGTYGFGSEAAADVDGDGYVDLVSGFSVFLNRSHRSREGNVNAAAGPAVDVLFVNGSPGVGRPRRLEIVRGDPFEIFVVPPPSAPPLGPVRYALYAWRGEPRESRCNQSGLPFGLGRSAMPTPLTVGSESPQPTMIWNNILGTGDRLGMPMRGSSPAPASVVERRRGVRVSGTFFLQGIIRDTAAPNGRAAVTNGVMIVSP